MFIRTPMKRWLRPPRLQLRLPHNVSRHFAIRFHEREHVEEERLSDYDPARYCPIEPGSTLEGPDTNESYTTMVKLGFGGTSTTWLCKERKYVCESRIDYNPIQSDRISTGAMPTKSSKWAQSP